MNRRGEAQARATETSGFTGAWSTRSRPELGDRLETFVFTRRPPLERVAPDRDAAPS
ncbi:hypothetical protein ACIQRK_20150 [Streptomyces anulatus]